MKLCVSFIALWQACTSYGPQYAAHESFSCAPEWEFLNCRNVTSGILIAVPEYFPDYCTMIFFRFLLPAEKSCWNPVTAQTLWVLQACTMVQRWPESLFQTLTPLLFQNVWIRIRQFFIFWNPTTVQTPATIVDSTVIYPCFYLKKSTIHECFT